MPRWLHQLWSWIARYFWLPCPECGRMFGGHEVRGPAYDGPVVVRTDGRACKILCPRCAPVVADREFRALLTEFGGKPPPPSVAVLKPDVLVRELVEMYGVIRIACTESMWRWVLSRAMVDLLRDYAASISETATTDLTDEARIFGIPVRVDEHALHPMLELRR